MRRTPLIKNLGRLAAAAGILAGLVLLAGPGVVSADEDDIEKPVAFAFGVAPGSVSVNWEHSGSGVAYYTVTRESPAYTWNAVPAEQRNLFDSNLQPNTAYRYYVCAYFYDGYFACSDWSEPARTQAPAPPSGGTPGGSPGGTPPPSSPPSTPAFTPELTATPAGGAQVNLKWNAPPAGSIVLVSVMLRRDGADRYEALQEGNLDTDHGDSVQPNSTHRYTVCFIGPAIGEQCSKEVVAGPAPVSPTAPTGLRVAEALLSGGRSADGSILLRPKHRISLTWRNTDIPGVFLTVEREDVKVTRNADPNSPVGLVRRSFWNELTRLEAKDRPASAMVDAPVESGTPADPTMQAGDRYRVCAVVPSLGDAGKVCTQPLTPEPPAQVQPSAPPVVVKPPASPCVVRGGC